MRLTHLSLAFIITLFYACQSSEKTGGAVATADSSLVKQDTSQSVKPSADNPEEELPVFKSGLPLDEIIPEGYSISTEAYGHLNDDTLTDCALVINNQDEMDSKILVVLFKNSNNTYDTSLITTSFITVRYDNELEIVDKKLIIHSDHPWHGTNFNNYALQYINKDWFCLYVTSSHDDANQSWNNEIDFVTGKFSVTHEVTTVDDQTHVKRVQGVLPKSSPFIASNGSTVALEIKYEGEEYYMWDRNDLWKDEELIKLLPKSYQEIIGGWSTAEKHPGNLSLQFDGNYYMDAYQEKTNKNEYTNGYYLIRQDSIFLDLDTLLIKRGSSGVHLKNSKGLIFTKDEE